MNIIFITDSQQRGETWVRKKLQEFRALFEPHMSTGEWLEKSGANQFVLRNGDKYMYCTKPEQLCGYTVDKLEKDPEGVHYKLVEECKFRMAMYGKKQD